MTNQSHFFARGVSALRKEVFGDMIPVLAFKLTAVMDLQCHFGYDERI